MFDFNITDKKGNSYLFELGVGGGFNFNSLVDCRTKAELLLERFSQETINGIYRYFYEDKARFFLDPLNKQRVKELQPQSFNASTFAQNTAHNRLQRDYHPTTTDSYAFNREKSCLIEGLCNADIIVSCTHFVKPISQEELTKEQDFLRTQIRGDLQRITAIQNQISTKPSTSPPSEPNSAWGLQLWLTSPDENTNPVIQAYRHFKTTTKLEPVQQKQERTFLTAEKRRLVESIGFKANTITETMLNDAWHMVDSIQNDSAVSQNFSQFSENYAVSCSNEHAGFVDKSGQLELALTISLIALSEGARSLIDLNCKTHLIDIFQKLGKRVFRFMQGAQQLAKLQYASLPAARNFKDLEKVDYRPKTIALPPKNETAWVEIKLIYEDYEPIANEKYIIVDCEGTQHTGTTNQEGMAKLNGLPKGGVEISFPDVQGWY